VWSGDVPCRMTLMIDRCYSRSGVQHVVYRMNLLAVNDFIDKKLVNVGKKTLVVETLLHLRLK